MATATWFSETPGAERPSRSRRLVGEALGCGLLVVALEGAHHGAEHLGVSTTDGRLFMSLAVGAVLAGLSLVLQPLSGAHFNPALTFADALEDGTPWRDVPRYVLAQLTGGLVGRLGVHLLCGEPLLIATRAPAARSAQFLTELVATFGLLVIVRGCVRTRPAVTPLAVAGYVAATVWFTDSRSLANPALVLARAASTRTVALPVLDVESFVAAQLLGAALAVCLFRWLQPPGQPAPGPWTAVFHCSCEGVAELAASLFNGLTLPSQVRAIAAPPEPESAVPPGPGDEAAPSLVLRLIPAHATAREALLGAVWRLPGHDLTSPEGKRRLRAELRGPLQRFLLERGWLRLRALDGGAREASRRT